MQIKIALPKGRLLRDTSELARSAGWELSDYSEGARVYHLSSSRFPELSAKVFQEKDIPIQVAMGNYDLGICGLEWVQELLVKYPSSYLIKLKNLGYGATALFLAASAASKLIDLASIKDSESVVTIASEFSNIAESVALQLRLKRFNIFPVWGAAEIYPPENADLVVIARKMSEETLGTPLVPVMRVMDCHAYLVANRISWESKDMSSLINSLYVKLNRAPILNSEGRKNLRSYEEAEPFRFTQDMVRLALPDGHAQKHVVNILKRAGIEMSGYPSEMGNRRPGIDIPGVAVKVIRPQDMPLQVANGNMDIAITGKDWVKEHLYKFPSSPITELTDLKYSQVKIVAAIHNDVPADNIHGLREYADERGIKLRIASEYVSIADKYARDHHLGQYCIIPTWGATESFLPDDADLLIENTETGSTLRRHNLKVIDTLFASSACLIANSGALISEKSGRIKSITSLLEKAIEEI